MSKEFGRREFLSRSKDTLLGALALPTVTFLGRFEDQPSHPIPPLYSPEIPPPLDHEYILPQIITIPTIEMINQSIGITGIEKGTFRMPPAGIVTPIECPKISQVEEVKRMKNNIYIAGHSNFEGKTQLAKRFEEINMNDEIILNKSFDKMTGEEINDISFRVSDLVIADLEEIKNFLFPVLPENRPKESRIILQTSFRVDRPGAQYLLDPSIFDKARIQTSKNFKDPSLYLCELIIANLET